MQHSTGNWSKSETARRDKMYALGCICCLQDGNYSQPQIHHILDGGRRMGHEFTIPLCPYHHVGEPLSGVDILQMRELGYGPPLVGSPAFIEAFGIESELLDETNKMIEGIDP